MKIREKTQIFSSLFYFFKKSYSIGPYLKNTSSYYFFMKRETFLRELKLYGEANDIPNISEKNAAFLRNMLREKKVQHMLEIGTANGYSTIHFALELEKTGGKIDTIEFSQLSYEMAQDNFEEIGLSHLISQYF